MWPECVPFHIMQTIFDRWIVLDIVAFNEVLGFKIVFIQSLSIIVEMQLRFSIFREYSLIG